LHALDDGVAEIASATQRANREIHLLRAYRTRLIADVVTGKLDVRGVELPALDEVDVLDDIETSEDAEVNAMGTMEEPRDD